MIFTTGVSSVARRRIAGASSHWSANGATLDALDTSLKAVYKFSNGALTTDSKGSNTLTNNNTVAGSASGKSGYCGDFERDSSQYLSKGSIEDGSDFLYSSSSGAKYLISTWINFETLPDTYSGASTYRNIIGVGRSNYSKYRCGFYLYSGVYYIYVAFNNAGGGSQAYVDASISLSASTWYNVCIGLDGSNLRVFVNNSEYTAGSRAYTTLETEGTNTFTQGVSISADGNLTGYWDGLMDETYIWKSPDINSTSIATAAAALYNSGDASIWTP